MLTKSERTIVVNFCGGPGVGKSTLSAGVFYHLKTMGFRCELAQEWIKGTIWEDRPAIKGNQIYIFAKQLKKVRDLLGKVQFIITDSPLFLSCVYMNEPNKPFHDLVLKEYKAMDNIVIYVNREKPYDPVGRFQNLKEAKEIDRVVLDFLRKEHIYYHTVDSNVSPEEIAQKLSQLRQSEVTNAS